MTRLESVFERLAATDSQVALFVDGPNVLRENFSIDLNDVRDVARNRGRLTVSRLYLDERAPGKLVQAAEARGFEVIVTSGDVDVRMAVEATELILEKDIDLLVIASRDTDFKPVLELARERGIATIALAPGEHGRSDALRNAADEAIKLSGQSDEDE